MVILENKADFQNFRNILDKVKKIGPNLNRNSLVLIILYINQNDNNRISTLICINIYIKNIFFNVINI